MPDLGPTDEPDRYRYAPADELDRRGDVWVYRGSRRSDQMPITIRKARAQSESDLQRWEERRELLEEVREAIDPQARGAVVEWIENFVVSGAGFYGTLYGVVTWIPGDTLDDVYTGRPPADFHEAAARIESLGAIIPVLSTAEERGVRYGDVKPANVVVRDGGTTPGPCALIDPGCIGRQNNQRYASPPWIPADVGFDCVDLVGLAGCLWLVLTGREPSTPLPRDPSDPDWLAAFVPLVERARSCPNGSGSLPVGSWWSDVLEVAGLPGPGSSPQGFFGVGRNPPPTEAMDDSPNPVVPHPVGVGAPSPPPGGPARPPAPEVGVPTTATPTSHVGSQSVKASISQRLQDDATFERTTRLVKVTCLGVAAVVTFIIGLGVF